MVPKEVYDTFDPEEQKLWHSHEFEVKSGMLILPKPAGYTDAEWEAAELSAMQEIIHLYAKTWHTWQPDAGHEYPLGRPVLMGSATSNEQIDLNVVMAKRNATFGVDHLQKAEARKDLEGHQIHESKSYLALWSYFETDLRLTNNRRRKFLVEVQPSVGPDGKCVLAGECYRTVDWRCIDAALLTRFRPLTYSVVRYPM